MKNSIVFALLFPLAAALFTSCAESNNDSELGRVLFNAILPYPCTDCPVDSESVPGLDSVLVWVAPYRTDSTATMAKNVFPLQQGDVVFEVIAEDQNLQARSGSTGQAMHYFLPYPNEFCGLSATKDWIYGVGKRSVSIFDGQNGNLLLKTETLNGNDVAGGAVLDGWFYQAHTPKDDKSWPATNYLARISPEHPTWDTMFVVNDDVWSSFLVPIGIWKNAAGEDILILKNNRLKFDNPSGNGKTEVVAFDLKQRQMLWTLESSLRNYTEAAIVGDQVLAIGFNDEAECIDLKTGKLAWKTTFENFFGGNETAKPIMANGQIIVRDQHKSVYAIDPATGKFRWAARLGLPNQISHLIGEIMFWNGKLWFCVVESGQASKIFCLNPANGGTSWEYAFKFEFGVDKIGFDAERGRIFGTTSAHAFALQLPE